MRFTKYWLPLLVWMALIFSASTEAGSPRVSSYLLHAVLHWIDPTMSPQNFEMIHIFVRKMGHLTEYAALGFLAFRAIRTEPRWADASTIRHVGAAVLFCALYASSDEYHQSFVPTRHPAVTDVMIDTAGAAVGITLTLAAKRLRHQE
jgi:VanZ family protein